MQPSPLRARTFSWFVCETLRTRGELLVNKAVCWTMQKTKTNTKTSKEPAAVWCDVICRCSQVWHKRITSEPCANLQTNRSRSFPFVFIGFFPRFLAPTNTRPDTRCPNASSNLSSDVRVSETTGFYGSFVSEGDPALRGKCFSPFVDQEVNSSHILRTWEWKLDVGCPCRGQGLTDPCNHREACPPRIIPRKMLVIPLSF